MHICTVQYSTEQSRAVLHPSTLTIPYLKPNKQTDKSRNQENQTVSNDENLRIFTLTHSFTHSLKLGLIDRSCLSPCLRTCLPACLPACVLFIIIITIRGNLELGPMGIIVYLFWCLNRRGARERMEDWD